MQGNLAILKGNFDWFPGKSTFFFQLCILHQIECTHSCLIEYRSNDITKNFFFCISVFWIPCIGGAWWCWNTKKIIWWCHASVLYNKVCALTVWPPCIPQLFRNLSPAPPVAKIQCYCKHSDRSTHTWHKIPAHRKEQTWSKWVIRKQM